MHHNICTDTGDEYRDKCIVLLRNALVGHKRPLPTKEQELYMYWKAATIELCVYRQHHEKVDEDYVEEIHRKIIVICDPKTTIRENLVDGSLNPQMLITDTSEKVSTMSSKSSARNIGGGGQASFCILSRAICRN
ncbi:6244_t:CDS:2 [Ambispora gerdemannii]|uniref:6244_t:CDS:1 n=1 Tax=Ambispora gerdemannii TaxID=144530 RepID=A0A9N9FIE0_9GLOM|nr:6244_t:CDS:2 [Ambispora gerdemannii]